MFRLPCKLALRALNLIQQRLSIVLFHRVLAYPDPMLPSEPDTRSFTRQMQWLQRAFTILPLGEAIRRLYERHLPVGALCVTFDDGYRDNALNALPILAALRIPATFFVTTGYLDGGLMWNDRVTEALRIWPKPVVDMTPYGLESLSLEGGRAAAAAHLLGDLKYLPFLQRESITADLMRRAGVNHMQMMMAADDIRKMHQAGMEVGGHTVNHPILCAIDLEQAHSEISTNKTRLEAIMGAPVEIFAYPNGRPRRDYDSEHIEVVRQCGYRHALTTAAGTASATSNAFQLPRFTPWDRTEGKYLGRMLQNYWRIPTELEALSTEQ